MAFVSVVNLRSSDASSNDGSASDACSSFNQIRTSGDESEAEIHFIKLARQFTGAK